MSSKMSGSSSSTPKNGLNIGVVVLVVIFLMIICFGFWGTCTESGKSTFTNIKNKLSIGGSSLKDLDILMFMNPTCPWCMKMMNVIKSEGQLNSITVVDITKPEGIAMSQQFGADKQPVPSFISRKLRTGTVGYRDSVAKLVDALKQLPQAPGSLEEPQPGGGGGGGGPTNPTLIQSLQIVLFARDGCGWCQKAKEDCSQAGIMDVIQVVDITTPEGQQMAGQVLPPGTSGVPAWSSLATKKHVIGYKPIDQIIQALQ